jgi:hypothetical protein
MSEWMKVMLDEIARKRSEAEQARDELDRRGDNPEPNLKLPVPPGLENDPPQG